MPLGLHWDRAARWTVKKVCWNKKNVDLLGSYGSGDRNARGWLLARWILRHNFHIMNRVKMRGWKPCLDCRRNATQYRHTLISSCHNNMTFDDVETALRKAGTAHGTSTQRCCKFRPSDALQALSLHRRTSDGALIRKQLSSQIRRLHRREVRQWCYPIDQNSLKSSKSLFHRKKEISMK